MGIKRSTSIQTTMRQQISFIAGLFVLILLTECTQQPTDIKLSELKSVCEYMDALRKLSHQYIHLVGDRSLDELTMTEKLRLDELMMKWRDIEEAGQKKYTLAERKECKSYELVINNALRVNEIIGNQKVPRIESEKDNLIRLLEDMLSIYDTLRTDNLQKEQEIKVNRDQMQMLLNRINFGQYDLSEARKEAETLRKILKNQVSHMESEKKVMGNANKEQIFIIYKHIPTGEVKEYDINGAYPWDDSDYEYVDRRVVIMKP